MIKETEWNLASGFYEANVKLEENLRNEMNKKNEELEERLTAKIDKAVNDIKRHQEIVYDRIIPIIVHTIDNDEIANKLEHDKFRSDIKKLQNSIK